MKTAIIIPTFNRKELLGPLLISLQNQTIKANIIVVVNDGSSDGTKEMLMDNFPDVRQLIGDGELWWTGSVNKGIKFILEDHSEIEGVILQNDDVVIDSNWLEKLLSVVSNNNKSLLGCAAVDVNNPNLVSYAGKKVNPWFGWMSFPYRGSRLSDIKPNTLVESFDLIGRGIYIPISVFHEIGLYDQHHFKHRGDTEFPLRAKMNGYKLLVTFEPLVKFMPDKTAGIDSKARLSIFEVFSSFFDFRSSIYWKYKYYYGKIFSKTFFQLICFFTFTIAIDFLSNVKRMIIPRRVH